MVDWSVLGEGVVGKGDQFRNEGLGSIKIADLTPGVSTSGSDSHDRLRGSVLREVTTSVPADARYGGKYTFHLVGRCESCL